ncbi:MAG TPA: bifunctional diaminohydroxyphosphoribosylaminopyrimidine deaminase/5-amino-6-(5-phosphoribosylamino)uracil reductase RibD [Candidatus Tectomicrobia bacterium]|jgi:diaminohydroxyphosphoribosylaminopyrimidine deaminase/5-amino-6-(5-phosphoribosylamino)uracil reductase
MTHNAVADMQYMQQALELARQGTGYVSPNPLVGCVIVKDGQVVGRGYHQRFGGPHAEVYALQEAGTRASGATLYVNLEPCSHTGKTPPCAESVVQAGIRRVVMALRDPNPLVAGSGLARLQQAGISVTVGIGEAEARQLNEAFLKYITTQCPFVTLKCAISLDGKIATRTGASRWITGDLARTEVHRLRHASDAIVVGIGTVLQDNPLLTTRLPDRRGVQALRVIVDSHLRLPLQAQVAQVTAECRTLVATTSRADAVRQQQLEEQGVEILSLPAYDDGYVNLEALWHCLGTRGVASVLVEGGATLSATLLRRRLVDKVLFFVAPKIIGGDGISVIGACGVETMGQVIGLQHLTGQRLGDDVVLQAYLSRSDEHTRSREGG